MRKKYIFAVMIKRTICLAMLLFFTAISQFGNYVQAQTPMRRTISPSSPMWLLHIDVWANPDPQKCIDLIPEDIRPFVVMNISLSVSFDLFGGRDYGFATAESWLRTCAENGIWATIQPSSGAPNHFSETEMDVYEYFYVNYPNFIGWNFCEQFWGFGWDEDKATYPERLNLFANLIKLANRYGGYLIVSCAQTATGAGTNPVAILKKSPAMEELCRTHPENFIMCEKYTTTTGFYDTESVCLGMFLSGYAGNYGIRFDECGWEGRDTKYVEIAGGVPILEHMMMTGETISDGPELTWQQAIHEAGTYTTPDGYTARKYEFFPGMMNVYFDVFRKFTDNTLRILSREEVIARTKIALLNDLEDAGDDNYRTVKSLFTGLYAVDGELTENHNWFKKTGRYPAIPTVYGFTDGANGAFETVVPHSKYSKRWPTTDAKVNEFNNMFPAESTGNMYVRRVDNNWLTYNPYMDMETTTFAQIPFKYNTCDSITLSYGRYTMGVISESADKLDIYLNNFRTDEVALRKNIIKIYGSTSRPTYTFADRGNHQASNVSAVWENGIYTITVEHNGPLELAVTCSGEAIGRLTNPETANVLAPAAPAVYTGPLQYEAENFDRKNIGSISDKSLSNYTALGYVTFGNNANASMRDTVCVPRAGSYLLNTRYTAPGVPITTVDIYVNGTLALSPRFSKTNDWNVNTQKIQLNAGNNIIEFRAKRATTSFYIDNIVIEKSGNSSTVYDFAYDKSGTEATTPAAQLVTVKSGTAGVVSYTDAAGVTNNAFKVYSAGSIGKTGIADLNLFLPNAIDYSIVWKEYYKTTGAKKGVLLRGSDSCSYAEGMKQGYLFVTENNTDNTVTLRTYIAGANNIAEQTTYTTTFKVLADAPCWYRATAIGNRFIFECSNDSTNWVGEEATMFTDDSYIAGSTQLAWGLGSGNFNWLADNITLLASNITVSRFAMDEFITPKDVEKATVQTFVVSGNALVNDIVLDVTDDFEISLLPDAEFASSVTIKQTNGIVSGTNVYVRMRSYMKLGTYSGEITISSENVQMRTVSLYGTIIPKSIILKYDFTDDEAKKTYTTPPAKDITVGKGNTAKAGVVSYTDANGLTGNMLKPYSAGQRNGTGVLNLHRFSNKSTDYSVTWKQYLGSGSDDYKIGVLLRGDTTKIADATAGYVQGIMNGYLFIVYNCHSSNKSEFRIYKSTSAYNSLEMLINRDASLNPKAGESVWYRASVSGNSAITLKFEYSTDSVVWNEGASTLDLTSIPFQSGATQIVWGLAANTTNFYLDDITFNGATYDEATSIEVPEWPLSTATVVSEEFYTMMGQRIYKMNNMEKGIYIVRRHMSDGTVEASKVYVK